MKSFFAALILFSALFNCSSTYAQSKRGKTDNAPKSNVKAPKPGKAAINYTMNWGPDLKLKGDAPDKILLYKNGSFYAITDAVSGFITYSTTQYISKFNKNMELELQKKVESKESDKSM